MNALSIEGTVVNILFENQPKTYVVAQLKQATESLPTVIVGGLSNIRTGEFLICHGDWKTHKSYGEQFWVDSYEVRLPTTRKSILDYLSSGWITGIGKGLAKKIVDVFGVDTFDIIEHSPEKLLTIRGISKRAQQAIVEAWSDQKESREILVFLQQHELSPHLAQKIYKQYGGFSTQTLRMNPYCLAEDIFGVGFVKADEIAQKLGIPADSLFRLEAGLLYMLKELARAEGHTCYPLEVFRQRALPFLKTSPELVDKGLSELLKSKKIHIDTYIPLGSDQPTEWIWLKYFHSSERGIVEHIRRLQTAPAIPTPKLEQALQEETNLLGIRLSDQQLEAVKACFDHKIHIITGGAGVGKSTIIKLVLRIFSHYTDKIVLAAPTGRAAKRLSEICNHPASTIHALLAGSASELEVAGAVAFQLSAEVVIVDETSMVDTLLLYALVKSLKNETRLVMVGDYNQLESVGAGDVLKNLIHSGQIPTSQLTEIFRQAAQSQIIAYADSVNRGIMPKFERVETGDFFFLNKSNPLEVVELVKELVVQRLPKRYGFDLLKDIQVLTPMNKGSLGTKVLNDALQKVCNPATEVLQNGLEVGYNRFWAGDKVIQTKNNYDKSVFNGDIGYVETVDMVNRCMQVNFEGRTVEYKQQEAMELELAYAISVHKYQGSECAGVIFILHDTHYKMLTRNLLYTGITRGKKLVLLLGTEQAVYTAVENNRSLTRYTGLLQFLLPDTAHLFEPIRHVPMLGSDNYAEFLKACQELGID